MVSPENSHEGSHRRPGGDIKSIVIDGRLQGSASDLMAVERSPADRRCDACTHSDPHVPSNGILPRQAKSHSNELRT